MEFFGLAARGLVRAGNKSSGSSGTEEKRGPWQTRDRGETGSNVNKRYATIQVLLAGAGLLLAVPSIVFTLVAFSAGMNPADTCTALWEQFTAERHNLAVVSLLGLFPLLLLAAFLGLRALFVKTTDGLAIYAFGGMLPIFAVALFVNLEFWPVFLPERRFAGFPHGLEFIIGPGVFAPVGMVAGIIVVWLSLRMRG